MHVCKCAVFMGANVKWEGLTQRQHLHHCLASVRSCHLIVFCLYGDHLLCIALYVLVSIVLLRASTRQVLIFRAPRLRDREDTNMSHAFFNGCCNRMHMMKSKSHSLDMLVGADNQNYSHIVQYILQTEHHCIRVYVYIYAYKIPDSCNTLQ